LIPCMWCWNICGLCSIWWPRLWVMPNFMCVSFLKFSKMQKNKLVKKYWGRHIGRPVRCTHSQCADK
jgi:hypothetical protein